MGQQFALRVDDGHRANVLALQRAAAGEFYQGDVVHGGNCGGFLDAVEITGSWRRAALVGERAGGQWDWVDDLPPWLTCVLQLWTVDHSRYLRFSGGNLALAAGP